MLIIFIYANSFVLQTVSHRMSQENFLFFEDDIKKVKEIKDKLLQKITYFTNEELEYIHINIDDFTESELLQIPHCYIRGKKKTYKFAYESMIILKNTYIGLKEMNVQSISIHDILRSNKCLIADGNICYCKIRKRKTDDNTRTCYEPRDFGSLTCKKHMKISVSHAEYVTNMNNDLFSTIFS